MNKQDLNALVQKELKEWEKREGGMEAYVKRTIMNSISNTLNSIISEKIRRGGSFRGRLDKAVDQWLKKVKVNDKFVLTTMKDSKLRQELKLAFYRNIKWQLSSFARDHAEAEARKLIKDMLPVKLQKPVKKTARRR